jgi:hypothetical protein
MAGRLILKGAASSVTEISPRARRARSGEGEAENVGGHLYLTLRLNTLDFAHGVKRVSFRSRHFVVISY